MDKSPVTAAQVGMSPQGIVVGQAPNPIMSLVGSRFAMIPTIAPTQACCNPILPQNVRLIPLAPGQQSMEPSQVKALVAQTKSMQAPIKAEIEQNTCCGNGGRGIYAMPQIFADTNGSPVFRIEQDSCCACPPRVRSKNANGEELGFLENGQMPCGAVCALCVCACVCRMASTPEWAWLKAVDPHGRERLTYRVPAQEGYCLLTQCNCQKREDQRCCCADIPDLPYKEHNDLYGPMPQPGAIGSVDVQGFYGWQRYCLCHQLFGVRPEMVTTVNLPPSLSYEDTVLAIQMALARTAAATIVTRHVGGRDLVYQLPFLPPKEQLMN